MCRWWSEGVQTALPPFPIDLSVAECGKSFEKPGGSLAVTVRAGASIMAPYTCAGRPVVKSGVWAGMSMWSHSEWNIIHSFLVTGVLLICLSPHVHSTTAHPLPITAEVFAGKAAHEKIRWCVCV